MSSIALPDLVKSLSVAFNNKEYENCEKLLGPIKVELIKHKLLIPNLQGSTNLTQDYINDLNITKQILEIGALTSIYLSKFEIYQNYFAQLRQFYFNDIQALNNSNNKSKLISLYLLILLSQGDVTRFHSELEYLDKRIKNLEDDELLSYPIKVDRWLMEGSYQKAWDLLEAGSAVPELDVFSKTLMDAIREEIAVNTELAYTSLPLINVKTLLFFSTEKQAEHFALEKGWTINNSIVYFPNKEQLDGIDNEDNEEEEEEEEAITENLTKVDNKLIQLNLIKKTMNYAINLETIV
ncbi:proteasome regulatory particle lid subunit RPN12 PWA37_001166 [Arxiozyma heterogenica]|uniref:proteasome regulatory particle lid subunit RPN12 n=1 Tax=Arxiozyma heterogenica TaxID=278026 RepID=UPI002EF51D40